MSAMQRHQLDIPGYEIRGVLGTGATSIVYRALAGDRDVAIKVMSDADDGGFELARTLFRREAAALARIDHACVVKVIEAGEARDRRYLVMELVNGDSLAQVLERGPLGEDALLELARDLASGLAEIHRSGMIHRDIKPANILVQANGRPKIIDFGFVARAQGGLEREVIGTFLYAAPEQVGIVPRPTDVRSDLYALGCVLYECAVGRPPFHARETAELLRMHASVVPVDPHQLRPEIRPVLSAIIATLLRKDPDDRYQTAQGLLWDLQHLTELEEGLRKGTLALGSRDAYFFQVPELPLLGRAAELERLAARWRAARAGRGCLVQVSGEAGSGKTRLIRELIQHTRSSGAMVLGGKAQKSERTPFGPLREAIDGLIAGLRRQGAEELANGRDRLLHACAGVPGIVKRLTRSLDQLFGDIPEIPPLEPTAEQERFYERVAEFFANLASEHGCAVLFLDDVQWLDDGTLGVLKRLAPRLEQVPLLVATTARNDRESQAGAAAVLEAMDAARIEQLQLGPLDPDTMAELASAHLGGRPLARPVVERLAARASGNPFALGQYVLAMLDAGLLRPEGAGWAVDLDRLNTLVLSGDAVQLLLDRVAGLPPEAQRVLCFAAVLGFTFDPELLVEASGQPPESVVHGIEAAIRANLIERIAGRCAFVHDRVQESMLRRATEDELRDAHQAAAEAIDRMTGGEAPDELLFQLARHYAAGHADAHARRVFETSRAAGVHALASYANEEAFQLLDRALAVTAKLPDMTPEAEAELRELVGIACTRTGRLPLAQEHFTWSAAYARTDVDKARLHYLISLVHSSEGKNDPAWAEIQAALGLIGSRMPERRWLQILWIAWLWLAVTIRLRTGAGFGSCRPKDRKRRELIALMLNAAYFIADFVGDRPKILLASFLRLHNSHFLGATAESAKALAAHTLTFAVLLGRRRLVEEMGQRSIAIAEQLGDKEALAYCKTMIGFSTDYAGLTLRGQELVRDSLPDAIKYCIARDAGLYVGSAGVSITHRGRSREAITRLEELLPILRRMGAAYYIGNVAGALHVQYACLGRARDGLHYKAEQARIAQEMPDTRFVQSFFHCHALHALYEQQDLGAELEDHIAKFLALRFDHYLNRVGYLIVAYVRLEQLMRAHGSGKRKAARRALKKALRTAAFGPPLRCVLSPVHRCHVRVIRAALAREEGKHRKALRELAHAEDDAHDSDSVWGLWCVHRERARIARCLGEEPAMREHARQALSLALAEGWTLRASRIRWEFELESELHATRVDPLGAYSYLRSSRRPRVGRLAAGSLLAASTSGTSADLSTQRYFGALLAVSRAAGSSLEPTAQARAALDALIGCIGAERAFLFLREREEVRMIAGRDAQGADQLPLTGYSSTVVRRVLEAGAPMIVTGTDEGEALGSVSAVTYDLRSIMAAPLITQDETIGALYVDSRLIKGLFTPQHLEIVAAIAAQLAISIEVGRSARAKIVIESERALLETNAVQTLFLPDTGQRKVGGALISSVYKPASRSGGGDWWWCEELEDGSTSVLLGDVTGHGAAAALLSVIAGSCYRALRHAHPHRPLPEHLHAVNTLFCEITAGKYAMTLSGITLTPNGDTAKVRMWNAGGPPVIIQRADGSRRLLTVPGVALGSQTLDLGERETSISCGDRLLLFSDGLFDVTLRGRPVGVRQVMDLLGSTQGLLFEDSLGVIVEALGSLDEVEHRDDVTLVLVEWIGTPRALVE